MTKSRKIDPLLRTLPAPPPGVDPLYAGYFACFNSARYYDAHDLLESLWLQRRATPGHPAHPDALFFKGLILLAGAFVHLQKQFLHPHHPIHALRVRPALRLLRLATTHLAPFQPRHLGLDVTRALALISRTAGAIEGSHSNPWTPAGAPTLSLDP